MPKQFAFCNVCRMNHDQGKGHKYSKSHKQRLDTLLSKFLQKINEVKFFLKNPSRLREEDIWRNKFWCTVCDEEIREEGSIFTCSNMIRHLASSKHAENAKKFWHDNGADPQRRHLYMISDEELVKWEDASKAISATASRGSSQGIANNIHSDYHYNKPAACEIVSVIPVANTFSDFVKPLPPYKDGSCSVQGYVRGSLEYCQCQCRDPTLQDGASGLQTTEQPFGHSRQTGSCGNIAQTGAIDNCVKVQANLDDQDKPYKTILSAGQASSSSRCMQMWRRNNQRVHNVPKAHAKLNGSVHQTTQINGQVGYDLTCVQPPPSLPDEGNVHSGAPPPWLQIAEGVSRVDSTLKFLSQTQERRLKVRNPKRVGAAWAEQRRTELEREKQGHASCGETKLDENWLPSFGRVWQSGSRRESRKEFDAETKMERKLGKIVQTTSPTKLQPYVSKRQKVEADVKSDALR